MEDRIWRVIRGTRSRQRPSGEAGPADWREATSQSPRKCGWRGTAERFRSRHGALFALPDKLGLEFTSASCRWRSRRTCRHRGIAKSGKIRLRLAPARRVPLLHLLRVILRTFSGPDWRDVRTFIDPHACGSAEHAKCCNSRERPGAGLRQIQPLSLGLPARRTVPKRLANLSIRPSVSMNVFLPVKNGCESAVMPQDTTK